MKELKVELGERSYPVYIGEGLLRSDELIRATREYTRLMVISNTTIAPLYLQTVADTLAEKNPQTLVLADGEAEKNLHVMNEIFTQLLQEKFARDCCLLALGGGVVGDITGFAAACYQRGIDYIQLPTTLLAQVDSSVGGKTAVNHALGKNMIGAFHQPVAVFADTGTLRTLPARELAAGLAEVIKYGLIRDRDFFCWLEENIQKLLKHDPESLQFAIERSCTNKAEVVAADEREQGQRALLNFGHTFGHAIETALNYQSWLHGEAVGLGMLMAAEMSHRTGWLSEKDLGRTRDLLDKAGLPLVLPQEMSDVSMQELMSVDKKVKGGRLTLVLLKGIGDAVVTSDFDTRYLDQTIEVFHGEAGLA